VFVIGDVVEDFEENATGFFEPTVVSGLSFFVVEPLRSDGLGLESSGSLHSVATAARPIGATDPHRPGLCWIRGRAYRLLSNV
jgi:hypothetical protein